MSLPEEHVRTYIRVCNGESLGDKVLLDQPVVSCGRHHKNNLTVRDDNVSRYHCRFVLVSGSTYSVEDAGSSNGTFVNGSLVRCQPLEIGDQVLVGSTVLEVASAEENSSVEKTTGDKCEDFDFDAELAPAVETARPILDSSIESYSQTADEQIRDRSGGDLDFAYRASRTASKNLTLESLCHSLVKLVGGWAKTDQAMLVLLDQNEQDFSKTFTPLVTDADSVASPSETLPKIKFHRGLVDRVLESRLPALSNFEVRAELSQKVAAMCVPIDNGQKLLGLIYVDDFQSVSGPDKSIFTDQGLEVFAVFGKQAAAVIENNLYMRGALADARTDAVEKLTTVVSHRMNNLLHLASGGEFLIESGMRSNDLQQVAQGWNTVKQAQNRIAQLTTNVSLHCRDFQPFLREFKPQGVVDSIVCQIAEVAGGTRVKTTHRTSADFAIKLDERYFDRAIRNVLAVGWLAAGEGDNGQGIVSLETFLVEDQYVVRVTFQHFDYRFNLPELGKGEINRVNVEHGHLEMLVSRKVAESHNGSVVCATDADNLNTIEIRFPLS